MSTEHGSLSSPELIKNKYYKAEEVNVLLKNCTDILKRLQAENQNQKKEIDALKKQCTEMVNQKSEVSEAIVSSKIVARQIIAEAKKEAEKIRTEAEISAQKIKDVAEQKATDLLTQTENEKKLRNEQIQTAKETEITENILARTAESFARLKEEQLRLTDQIDEEWKELLIQICGDQHTENKPEQLEKLWNGQEKPESTEAESENEMDQQDEIPDDITEKVEAIARQLKIFIDDEE